MIFNRDGIFTPLLALILVFLEQPVLWETGSKFLAHAMAGDGTELYNMLLPDYDLTDPDNDLGRLAVSCLDTPRPKSQDDFRSIDGKAAGW